MQVATWLFPPGAANGRTWLGIGISDEAVPSRTWESGMSDIFHLQILPSVLGHAWMFRLIWVWSKCGVGLPCLLFDITSIPPFLLFHIYLQSSIHTTVSLAWKGKHLTEDHIKLNQSRSSNHDDLPGQMPLRPNRMDHQTRRRRSYPLVYHSLP